MTKKFDALVFMGRFSPFHNGHKSIIDAALEQANEVIVVVGSSFAARTVRNPFTFDERKTMIKSIFPQNNVKVVPVSDYPYDDNKWVAAVQSVVRSAMRFTPDPIRIGLIGHSKDNSSYYLKIFRTWGNIEVPNLDGINATDIREIMFNDLSQWHNLAYIMPRTVMDYVGHITSEKLERIQEEYDFNKKYKKIWETSPFPPIFVTTDAVLTQSGHILLVKRGKHPGKGLWALPGGYLEHNITIMDNMIKELREETCVKVPDKVLRGSIKEQKVFDEPTRDPRGRTLTHAFYIDLGFPVEPLPKVKGDSDAVDAKWIPFGELKQEAFAFDHWHIINYFLNLG